MEFVEQHGGDAVERRIVEDQPREHALGDDLDARACATPSSRTARADRRCRRRLRPASPPCARPRRARQAGAAPARGFSCPAPTARRAAPAARAWSCRRRAAPPARRRCARRSAAVRRGSASSMGRGSENWRIKLAFWDAPKARARNRYTAAPGLWIRVRGLPAAPRNDWKTKPSPPARRSHRQSHDAPLPRRGRCCAGRPSPAAP